MTGGNMPIGSMKYTGGKIKKSPCMSSVMDPYNLEFDGAMLEKRGGKWYEVYCRIRPLKGFASQIDKQVSYSDFLKVISKRTSASYSLEQFEKYHGSSRTRLFKRIEWDIMSIPVTVEDKPYAGLLRNSAGYGRGWMYMPGQKEGQGMILSSLAGMKIEGVDLFSAFELEDPVTRSLNRIYASISDEHGKEIFERMMAEAQEQGMNSKDLRRFIKDIEKMSMRVPNCMDFVDVFGKNALLFIGDRRFQNEAGLVRHAFSSVDSLREYYAYVFDVFQAELARDAARNLPGAARFLARIGHCFGAPDVDKLKKLIAIAGRDNVYALGSTSDHFGFDNGIIYKTKKTIDQGIPGKVALLEYLVNILGRDRMYRLEESKDYRRSKPLEYLLDNFDQESFNRLGLEPGVLNNFYWRNHGFFQYALDLIPLYQEAETVQDPYSFIGGLLNSGRIQIVKTLYFAGIENRQVVRITENMAPVVLKELAESGISTRTARRKFYDRITRSVLEAELLTEDLAERGISRDLVEAAQRLFPGNKQKLLIAYMLASDHYERSDRRFGPDRFELAGKLIIREDGASISGGFDALFESLFP
ncbi:MAG: hypothetical protein WC418_07560, partial [Candidatus Omnitrophota bacterium]